MPRVTIIIISFNRCEDLRLVLESVRANQYPDLEVIVVDNASKDASLEVAASFPEVKIIRNQENLGFAEANNQGLAQATGSHIALVNNDAVLAPDWIQGLSEFLETHPEAAAVGGKAYLWDEQNSLWNRGNRYYSYTLIDPENGHGTAFLDTSDDVLEVATLSGCAVMIRRAAIEDVGEAFLEPIFFTYYEETDFFARAIRKGWKLFYLGEPAVWHHVRASTAAVPYHYHHYMERNRILYAYRNFGSEELRRIKTYLNKRILKTFLIQPFRLFRFKNEESRAKWKAWAWCVRNRRLLSEQRARQGLDGKTYNQRVRIIQSRSGYYGHSRPEVVKHVPSHARTVVDIGCGAGALGNAVKQRLVGVEVRGVEISSSAAKLARNVLDEVHHGSAEDPMPTSWPVPDCLVFADVLEHLTDPWTVLKSWVERLPVGGSAIISLPNIAHGSIILGLLKGKWDYVDAGILDQTHLRFFTRASAIDLLEQSGLKLQQVERVVEVPFRGSMGRKLARWIQRSQRSEPLAGRSKGFRRFLLDFGTVQFVLVGTRRSGEP
jgi:GT2 family glycosyltransferase